MKKIVLNYLMENFHNFYMILFDIAYHKIIQGKICLVKTKFIFIGLALDLKFIYEKMISIKSIDFSKNIINRFLDDKIRHFTFLNSYLEAIL